MHPLIPHTRTEITAEDEAAVLSALRGRVLVEADHVRNLENWFTEQFGGAGAVATGSCSQALVVALKACGVGPGHDVILPSYVCAQVLAAVEHVGARGVTVDVAGDWMIDKGAVRDALTSQTRAIITAQMFGMFRDMSDLRSFGVPVIEDCAQTFPDWQNPAHRLSGDIVVFSFEATKPVAGGEGGMVLVRTTELMAGVRAQKQFRETPYRANFYPLGNATAALVQSQLARYPQTLNVRSEKAKAYIAALDDIAPGLVTSAVRNSSAWHRFLVRVEGDPQVLIQQFSAHGIAVRRPVEMPLHLLCPDTAAGSHVMTERLWGSTLSLPIYPELSVRDQGRVIDACRQILT
ncbi:aminotransferase class I/II-fold pyridoxal phosphate-dependent enzyme [Alphaproteobacteria bacterium HT1-32]|nr:aminotransferase class I/II-fold pyridoxal phosphate-dependent enzyme [Alphaproteobacteria bacterium HT1-32]